MGVIVIIRMDRGVVAYEIMMYNLSYGLHDGRSISRDMFGAV
jgi:hypothetical protein